MTSPLVSGPSPLVARLPRSGLVLLALGILVLGCASRGPIGAGAQVGAAPPTPRLDSVPEWALASPGSAPDAMVGIGSGASLAEATRYALRDVSARLSVSVESRLRDTLTEDSDGVTVERLEQVIETRVLGTRFSGWQRTRSAERDGIFWVEVRIDRQQLARDARDELIRLADEIDLRIESAQDSTLRRLWTLQDTQRDRERVGDLIPLVGMLDPGFDRSTWVARRAGWREAEEAARRALVFEIRTDALSGEIARWVASRLASDRLRTRGGTCLSPDAICIDIRSELTETDVASRHIARIRSTFSVLEPGGTVLAERDLVGRGDSQSDRDRARRLALDDLRSGIAAGPLLAPILGH